MGAQKAEMVLPGSMLPTGIQCMVTTDDGSMGIKGRTTDILPDYIGEADRFLPADRRQCIEQCINIIFYRINPARFHWKYVWHAEWESVTGVLLRLSKD